MNTLAARFDFRYLIKFALSLAILYYVNLFMIGATTLGGTYYPFLDKYLNYPVWIRTTILYTSRFVLNLLGYASFIKVDTLYSTDMSRTIFMGWPCYGLMLMSFWFSFVIAGSSSLAHKAKWVFAGWAIIWVINVTRISLLFVSIMENWSIGEKFASTNHDLFNYVSYAVLGILIYIYTRKRPMAEQAAMMDTSPAVV